MSVLRFPLHFAMRALVVAASVCTLSVLATLPGATQPKSLTLVVGGDAGITYDTYARLLSRHFSQHFPGSPPIVVQNMPGAGSMKAAQYMFAQAPKDGATFALLFPGALIGPLMDPGRVRFDPTKFEYLGTLVQDTRACVTSGRSKVKTFEDARRLPSVMAGTQHGSSTVDYPNMLNAVAGTRFKVVAGYKSTNETILAIERGEADGMCSNLGTFVTQKPEWLDPPGGQTIVAMGIEPHPDMIKRHVPYISQFLSGQEKAIADLIVAQQGFGRPFLLPPGTPAPAVATMRKAFEETYNDKAFLDEAEKLQLEIAPLDGDKVSALIKQMYAAPQSIVDGMARALQVVKQ